MRYASIDIGTNTVLLLILEVGSGIREILDICESPRLGQNLHKTGRLSEEATERTISTLERYKKLIEREGVENVFVFGTAVLREAENGETFIKRARETLGVETEILTEEREAYYSFLSVVMDPNFEYKGEVIIDIGGGSTEVMYVGEKELEGFVSLPIGAVKLKESFLKNDPPEDFEIYSLIEMIENVLNEGLRKKKANIVGVGGTVTSLGAILSGKNYFDKDLIHGMKVPKEHVESLLNKMKQMSHETIEAEFPFLGRRRADVILSGIVLLERIMDFFRSKYMKISTKGARYGLIYERVKEAQGALRGRLS